MRSPHSPQVSSFAAAEAHRRVTEECLREIQISPGARSRVLADVVLADGIVTPVAHKLGRTPIWVKESCVRGAVATGRVEEVRDGSHDRTRVVALRAVGYGGPITVDVWVA
jgi:hypothetical protein